MKRRSLFAWLAGAVGLGAQSTRGPLSSTNPLDQTGTFLTVQDGYQYKNGYCPQCGTQAPPFHKPMEWDYYPSGYVRYDEKGQKHIINLTRCANCANAFFQDAEERP